MTNLVCIAWGDGAPHTDCPVVLRAVDEAAVPVTVKLPAVCPCECRTCKQAWWDDDRPRVDRKTGEITRATSKPKGVFAEDIFKKQGLTIRPSCFECPYCQRTVHRGGKAEGFRKSGFAHHVYGCWEIGLYLRGYFVGEWVDGAGKQRAIPVEDAKAADWGKRFIRGIKATMRRRAKDGELEALRPVPTSRLKRRS